MSQWSRTLALGALAGAATLAAAPASAQGLSDKLTVHGYLTQGYGWSDSLPILGLGTEASGDYRSAALQFRYGVTERDHVVLQLSHRRVGSSVISGVQDDVALDWGFYQHRFATGTSVKVGKVAMPRGIYNEIRDVGTVLPFYRAPFNFYTEGLETIDGLVVSHTLPLGSWTLDASAYGGGFEFKQAGMSQQGAYVIQDKAERAVGGQLWVGTPLPGLRVGLGGMRFDMQSFAILGATDSRRGSQWLASVDGNFDRVLARAELARFAVSDFVYDSWYVQGGVRVTQQVGVYGQADVASIAMPSPLGPLDYEYARDYAVGMTYALTPGLVFKLEGHRATGYSFDQYIPPVLPAGRTNYVLGSVSASF